MYLFIYRVGWCACGCGAVLAGVCVWCRSAGGVVCVSATRTVCTECTTCVRVCVQEEGAEAAAREKRKLEGVTQAKFGIKNAVLGFVFGVSTTPTATGRRG